MKDTCIHQSTSANNAKYRIKTCSKYEHYIQKKKWFWWVTTSWREPCEIDSFKIFSSIEEAEETLKQYIKSEAIKHKPTYKYYLLPVN